MLMFDSLNRRMLPAYGCDFTQTPNFRRLAERTVTFENSYVGSMPCMPARRELHTGRYNFLHRSWGPLEPFDDSMPEMLKSNGVYSHLVSDHYHYWEDGGCTYHERYSTWDFSRGQEGDPWKGHVRDPEVPDVVTQRSGRSWRQDWVNRRHVRDEHDFPQAVTFNGALEFLETNRDEDNWFLHVETFDPHEPFFAADRFREMYEKDPRCAHFDWPLYGYVKELPEEVENCRKEYFALLSMCDHHLGRVLDFMDANDLWRDTMLIVNTDHGFLLGEHDMWAKCWAPFYNEVAHSPLFIWDPRSGVRDERRSALVQTIDLAPTVLDLFGVDRTPDMQGVPLRETVATDAAVREAGLYGMHGGHVNVTDGRYVYMRAPARRENTPLYNYTLMPTHMNKMFGLEELRTAELAEPFSFTKEVPVMRMQANPLQNTHEYGNLLFDLENDAGQEHPLDDPEAEQTMVEHLTRLLKESDAPKDQFERLGL